MKNFYEAMRTAVTTVTEVIQESTASVVEAAPRFTESVRRHREEMKKGWEESGITEAVDHLVTAMHECKVALRHVGKHFVETVDKESSTPASKN